MSWYMPQSRGIVERQAAFSRPVCGSRVSVAAATLRSDVQPGRASVGGVSTSKPASYSRLSAVTADSATESKMGPASGDMGSPCDVAARPAKTRISEKSAVVVARAVQWRPSADVNAVTSLPLRVSLNHAGSDCFEPVMNTVSAPYLGRLRNSRLSLGLT